MNRKSLQQQAVDASFNRNKKDDWEIIATEQYEENKTLLNEISHLKEELLKNKEIVRVDAKRCKNWKYSDRNSFEMGDIDGLAEDIKTNGQLQPAIIRKIQALDFDYEIICGERRWRACIKANIPLTAIITDKNDIDCIAMQTSENKKKSLSPYSLAKVYEKVMIDEKISQNELAKRLGMPKSSFGNLMSFNKVPDEVWKLVEDMSKVKAKTAAFLAATCAKGAEFLNAVLNVASKIREGVGIDNLQKSINKFISNSKTSRNLTQIYENKNGELLFRVTSQGHITISKPILKKVNIEKIAEHLKEHLEQL